MRKSILTRVLVVAITTGFVGGAGATITSCLLTRGGVSRGFADILTTRYDPREVRRCQADPAAWDVVLSAEARAFAYDERTRQSANPGAPPLRAELYAKLPPGDHYVVDFNRHRRGVSILLRRHAAAPCDLIQLISGPSLSAGHVLTTETTGALATGFACCFFAVLAIGVPLARRLRRLQAAASRVGEQDYTPCAARRGGNELDELASVLDTAHVRIRADASLLEQQRNALERHLNEIAHDLRTPLTSLHAALERATGTPGAASHDLLAGALFDVVYLSALTDNLRLASQLRDGSPSNLDAGAVDLCAIVERVALRARMLARRRDVSLEMAAPDAPLIVRANAIAVEQALTNIVQNAIAYVDPGGHVAIVLRAGDGRAFTLDVRDDGPGVPPLEIPRLASGTFRSDEARQRDPRGRGIGLAITAEVCRRFGWTLSFHALEPRGLGVRVDGRAGGHSPMA